MPYKGTPTDYLKRVLKEGDTVVDVGANVGHLSEDFANMVGPTGTVWAFEADDRSWPDLDAKAIALPQIKVVHAAAGDKAGVTEFHRCIVQPSNSSRFKSAILAGVLPPQLVPMLPLDAVCERADAVKIDVQGGELDVLRGAQSLRWHCPVWVLEIWPFGLGHATKPLREILTLFEAAGLHPHWMCDGQEPERATDQEALDWALTCTDIQFVNMVFKA